MRSMVQEAAELQCCKKRPGSVAGVLVGSAAPFPALRAVPLPRFAGEDRGCGLSSHRSFNVERPTSASTKAMIQKRMTIWDSDQPNCSKW